MKRLASYIIVLLFVFSLVLPFCYSVDYTNNQRPFINVTFGEQIKSVINVSLDGDYDILERVITSKPDDGKIFFAFKPSSDLVESDKPFLFRIIAEDEISNFAVVEREFIVDITPPNISCNIEESQIIKDSKKRIDVDISEYTDTIYVELNGLARTDLFDTFDNMLFQANVENISDGDKKLYVYALDKANNANSIQIDFAVVTKPLEVKLLDPSFGVSNKTSPIDIKVSTNRQANCKSSTKRENYEDMPEQFITDGYGLVHEGLFKAPIPQYPQTKKFYVACEDKYGLNKDRIYEFELSFDIVKPEIIEARAIPSIVEDIPETTLYVMASEEVRCKYSLGQVSYDSMIKFPDYDSGGFKEINNVTIDTPQAKGEYTYYIICEDKAPWISDPAPASINVDLGRPLRIIDNTPDYFKSRITFINFSTSKHAFCYYKLGKDTEFTNSMSEYPGYSFYKGFSQAGQGAVQYDVWCYAERNPEDEAFETITLTVDLTSPVMLYVNTSNPELEGEKFTYKTDRLYARWKGFDNESGVKHYNVSIAEEGWGKKPIYSTIISANYKTFTGLKLKNLETYVVRAKAMNNAGMWSSTKEDKITVDTSKKPSDKPAHCRNNEKDGDETGIDCGGSCNPCGINDSCIIDEDCKSMYCNDGKCAVSYCNDTEENGYETDVDCGGPVCPECDSGYKCINGSDCISGDCDPVTKTCKSSGTCDNGIIDGIETGVDCGGGCEPCGTDENCLIDDDCLSKNCVNDTCQAGTCNDSIKNELETDTDCGGSVCIGCIDDESCLIDSDCISGSCDPLTKTCVPSGPCSSELDCPSGNKCIAGNCTYCAPDDKNCNGIPDDEEDNDEDGIPDSWEVDHPCMDPTSDDSDADFDGDGLTNYEEYKAGTDPCDEDSDGDGWSDSEEIEKNSNPLDPNDHPSRWWLWLLLLLLLLVILGLGGFFGYKGWNEYTEVHGYTPFDWARSKITKQPIPQKQKLPPLKPVSRPALQPKKQKPVTKKIRELVGFGQPKDERVSAQKPSAQKPSRFSEKVEKSKTEKTEKILEKEKIEKENEWVPLEKIRKVKGEKPKSEKKPGIFDKLNALKKKQEEGSKIKSSKTEKSKTKKQKIPVKASQTKKTAKTETPKPSAQKPSTKKLSAQKPLAQKPADKEIKKHTDRLTKVIGRKASAESIDKLKNLASKKKLSKEHVTSFFDHISKDKKTTKNNNLELLSHIIDSKKMSKQKASEALETLRKKKLVNKDDKSKVLDNLKKMADKKGRRSK